MILRSQALCCFLPLLWLPAFGADDVVLDPAFGTSGLVLPAFPGQPSNDSAGDGRCVAVQEDGKILLAGHSLAGGRRHIVVLRFLADGQPDAAFGSGGVALLNSPHGDDQATALRLHDGGILVAGRSFSGGTSDMLLHRLNSDGTPDTDFGSGGRLQVDFDGGDDTAQALAVDTLDRIVVAGTATQAGKRSAAVLRCLANGTPDNSFGTAGRAAFAPPLGASAGEGRDLVIQSSGRIVVGGYALYSTSDRFGLFAFTTAGVTDTSFGTDGSTVTIVGSGSNIQSQGQSLIALTGGQLLLAGTGTVSGVSRAALACYSANGVLDTGFGTGGTVLTSAGTGETRGRCVIQQPDGSLLIAAALDGASLRFAALRYTSGGSLDTNFGSSGITLVAFPGYDADCMALSPSPDGFLLAGTLGASASSYGLARCTAQGALDTTFSGDGRLGINLRRNAPFSQARSIRQQSDGKVVVAGSVSTDNGVDWIVCRFLADGSADPDFGNQSQAVLAIGTGDDFAYRMALQPDGKILVAGTSTQNGYEVACVIRLLADGSLDPDFGSGGIFLDQTGGADCGAYALALQTDGRIVMAGYAYNGAATRLQCALWRLTSDGVLDTDFSADGRLLSHVTATTRDAYATAVAVQSDGKIVTAGPAFTDGSQTQSSFGLLRCLSTGTLDTNFDGDGRLAVTPAGHAAQAQAVAIQGDGALIVAGFVETGGVGGASSMAAVRILTNGVIDGDYAASGWAIADFAGFGDMAHDLAIDAEGRALLAGTTYTTHSRIALLRLTTTGAPDADFAVNGQSLPATGAGHHLAYGASFDTAGRLLIAGSADSSLMGARLLMPNTVNTDPVAVNDQWSVLPGRVVLLDVLANDTDADDNTLTIASWSQPVAGGNVTKSGSQLQFTSAATFIGASFSYTIDDGAGGQDTATVTLTPISTYAAWRIAWFGEDAATPEIAGPLANPDSDSLDNLAEYALGTDPLQTNVACTIGRDGNGRLTLTYQVWVAAGDVTITPMFCTDLTSWDGDGVLLEVLSDDGILRTQRATAPASLSLQAQFGLLNITEQP